MTAFEQVFTDNRAGIYRYLLKLTKNSSLAEELTQETFFRAYMNFSSLRDPDRAGAWLCTIARNTFYAWYQAQKKQVPLEDETLAQDTASIDEQLARKELSRDALACVHALEEPYKEVFLLSVFGGFSLKDISAIFGKSESWARVTYYRAKQKLLERLKQNGM